MPAGIGVRDKGGGSATGNECTGGRGLENEGGRETWRCGMGGKVLWQRDIHEKRHGENEWLDSPWRIGRRLSGTRRRPRDLRARQEAGVQPSPTTILNTITVPSTVQDLNMGAPATASGTNTGAVVTVTDVVFVPQMSTDADIQTPTTLGTRTSSDQVVLSPTPPPSPAESASTFSEPFPVSEPSAVTQSIDTTLPSDSSTATVEPASSTGLTPAPASSNPASLASLTSLSPSTSATSPDSSPVVTVTSYLISTTTAPGSVILTTTTETRWLYSTTTMPGTVLVYATPAGNATSARSTISSISSSTASSTPLSTTRSSPTNTFIFAPTYADGYGGGWGGDITASPTTTETSNDSDNDGSSLTPKLVGGIIGGLAGMALFLWVILLFIRRYKQKMIVNRRVEAGYGGPPPSAMTERSSSTNIAGWGLGSFGRNSRRSAASEPISEERGFYKVSGRKLPPAIGGPRPDIPAHSASLNQDEESRWLGGPRTLTPVASPTSSRPSRYSGGTQVTSSPTSSGFPAGTVPLGLTFAQPSSSEPQSYPQAGPSSASPYGYSAHPPGPSMPGRIPEENGAEQYQAEIDRERERSNTPQLSVQRSRDFAPTPVSHHRDGLGRSLPSLDGSRTSRFTEDIV